MENHEFDQLARESVGAPSRRTLVRGLAAALGVSGLGLALLDDADAESKKKKRRERQKKQQKRKEKKKDKNYECDYKDKVCVTPTNPCQAVSCNSDHKCVTSNVANGTTCGGGRVCTSGTCNCPAGKTCEVSVSPAAMNDWVGYNDVTDKVDNSVLVFVSGPGNPPYGNGSVQMSVSAQERKNIATYQFSGTKLSDITQLKFTTYNPSGTNNQGPNSTGYLHFNVDFNGSDTWQKRLVFVPKSNGTVKADQWQEWDAINNGEAVWILSGGTWPNSDPADTPKTWDEIIAENPQVRIRVTDAFLGIRIGEPYPDGFTGNVGSVTFGTATGSTRFVFGPAS